MLLETLRILRRLWAWVLVIVLVSAGAGAAVVYAVQPTQQSMAQVLLVPSVKQPGVDDPTNPFLSLSGSVAVVASLVQISVSDDRTAQQLWDDGFRAKFEVVPNLNENAGPVLIVTTEDRSAKMAQLTLDAVVDVMQTDLKALQDSQGVAEDLRVRAIVLTSTAKPEVIRKTQIQFAVAAVGAAFLVLIGLLLLAERGRRARARHRRAAANTGLATASADEEWPDAAFDDDAGDRSPVAAARGSQ